MKLADLKRTAPPWAEWLVIIVLVLCAAGGLYTLIHPPTFTEREIDVHVVKRVDDSATVHAAQLALEVERWKSLATKRTKRVEEPVLLACDGGVPIIAPRITEEIDERHEANGERSGSVASNSSSTATHTEQVDEQRHEVTKTLLPNWRVSLGVGWAIGTKPALQLRDGLTLGGDVTFRVPIDKLGVPTRYGLWLGAGGSTVGEVRVVGAFEF